MKDIEQVSLAFYEIYNVHVFFYPDTMTQQITMYRSIKSVKSIQQSISLEAVQQK